MPWASALNLWWHNEAPTMVARTKGYTYLEVLVALLVFAIALVPAMEAMQSSLGGIRQSGAATTTRDVSDEQAAINKMERLLALDTATLSASPSGVSTAHGTLSDASTTVPRCLVYTSWYKPEEALEADRFVSVSTSKLLWVKVAVEGGGASAVTLVFIP